MFLAQALRQGTIFDVFTGGPRARTVTVICALRLDATHALARANELSSTFKAAARSTLSPDADPARLRPTACASPRPNHISKQPKMCIKQHAPRGRPNGRTWRQPLPPAPHALETQAVAPLRPSRMARAPLADLITTRMSAASQAPARCSWWFSASGRRHQVDLERTAPKAPKSSPIMMVAPAPPHRYHVVLILDEVIS